MCFFEGKNEDFCIPKWSLTASFKAIQAFGKRQYTTKIMMTETLAYFNSVCGIFYSLSHHNFACILSLSAWIALKLAVRLHFGMQKSSFLPSKKHIFASMLMLKQYFEKRLFQNS